MTPHPERTQDYLEHMLEALERIQRYAAGKSATDFVADTLLQDAVLRNLGILGEAARRLLADSPDYAAIHPEIPFAKIYGTRNRITHGYEEVDLEIVWNLVVNDVSALLPKIVAALSEFKAFLALKPSTALVDSAQPYIDKAASEAGVSPPTTSP